MQKACFDLDGVLCHDPPEWIGEAEYLDFLEHAELLYYDAVLPGDIIITGRLEKYRELTEDWLRRHGVQYSRLIMKPDHLKGVENTPSFKAQHYGGSNTLIFFESCARQAPEIARLSGKPVYCIENQNLYHY